MFSRPAVRSVEEIKQGLLSRAFARGGQKEYEKMELLIEWRLAQVRHEAQQTIEALDQEYRLSEFENCGPTQSRGIYAFNLVAHIEGRKDRLHDDYAAERIKHMKRWEEVKLLIKKSIMVDLDSLKRKSPDAPIEIDHTPMLPDQRSMNDPVYHTLREEDRMASTEVDFLSDNKPSAKPSKLTIH